jgi:hypothetical protein
LICFDLFESVFLSNSRFRLAKIGIDPIVMWFHFPSEMTETTFPLLTQAKDVCWPASRYSSIRSTVFLQMAITRFRAVLRFRLLACSGMPSNFFYTFEGANHGLCFGKNFGVFPDNCNVLPGQGLQYRVLTSGYFQCFHEKSNLIKRYIYFEVALGKFMWP